MKHSASIGFAPSKSLFRHILRVASLSVGVAALSLTSQMVFAQHVGGGHSGGGGSSAGGGGGSHYSPPPAPRTAPAPSVQQPHPVNVPHTAPAVVYVPPRVLPPVNSAVIHSVPGAPIAGGFHDPRVGNSISNPQAGQPGRNIVVGFPPAQPGQFVQGNSTTPPAVPARPGLLRRIFGDGHQIWSEPAHTATSPATASGSNTIAGSAFHGPAGLAPAAPIPVAPTHVFNYPPGRFRGPIYFGPGYGFGYGYPFFGSPFGFGNSFFFGNSYFGYQVGSVFVPCNGFGPGLICMPYNYNYNFGYDSSYDTMTIPGRRIRTPNCNRSKSIVRIRPLFRLRKKTRMVLRRTSTCYI